MPSIKAALDVNWFDPPKEKARAIRHARRATRRSRAVDRAPRSGTRSPSSAASGDALHQIRAQDLEETANGPRIRQGVADRRVSIEDAEMRHGHATAATRSMATSAISRPISTPTSSSLPRSHRPICRRPLHCRRCGMTSSISTSRFASCSSTATTSLATSSSIIANHGEVICRPWQFSNRGLFAKTDFAINIRDRTITCPQGQTQRFEFGTTVSFDGPTCRKCRRYRRSAPRPWAVGVKSASAWTRRSNNAFGISSRPPVVATGCGRFLSSTGSRTSPVARVARPLSRRTQEHVRPAPRCHAPEPRSRSSQQPRNDVGKELRRR